MCVLVNEVDVIAEKGGQVNVIQLQRFKELNCKLHNRLTEITNLFKIDVSFFADEIRETTTNTTDGGHGKHDVTGTIDVSVLNTQNVLELVRRHQRHFRPNLSEIIFDKLCFKN